MIAKLIYSIGRLLSYSISFACIITAIAVSSPMESGPEYNPRQRQAAPPKDLTEKQREKVQDIIDRARELRRKSFRQYRRYQCMVCGSVLCGIFVSVALAAHLPVWLPSLLGALAAAGPAYQLIARDQELGINGQRAAHRYEKALAKLDLAETANPYNIPYAFRGFIEECEQVREEFFNRSLDIAEQKIPYPGLQSVNDPAKLP